MRPIRLILLVALLSLASGCWDAVEIDRRAFMLVIGIDRDVGGYLVTGRPSQGSADEQSKEPQDWPVWSARGRTVSECLERLAGLSDRTLDWANLRAVILGEPMARRGVKDAVRDVLNTPRVPGDITLLQAKGPAADLIASPPPGGETLQSVLENNFAKSHGGGASSMLVPGWRFLAWLQNPGQEPYIGGIERLPSAIAMKDAAMFNGDRLSGWLGPARAKVFGWTAGLGGGYTVFAVPGTPGAATIRILSVRRRLSVRPGRPDHLLISLDMSGEMAGVPSSWSIRSPDDISVPAARHIRGLVEDTMRFVRRTSGADIWGFGERMRRCDSSWSPRLWPQRWLSAKMEVRVRMHIHTRNRFQLDAF